ncbi:hypothetical protein J6590_045338 [Homalodisca vitripennis]|nr:hypothetical protein J6590_045338 [Homalodisca vitripennis]
MDPIEGSDNDLIEINSCIQIPDFSLLNNFFSSNNGHDKLKIYHCNIRSYSKNIDELMIYLSHLNFNLDILVMTECWLSDGVEGVSIDGFDIYFTDKQRNRNDGTILYVNKRLTATAT